MTTIDRKQAIDALCALTLKPHGPDEAVRYVIGLDTSGRRELIRLADSNHVLIRALVRVSCHTADAELSRWATVAIADEHERIRSALRVLHDICTELEGRGMPGDGHEVARPLARPRQRSRPFHHRRRAASGGRHDGKIRRTD